MKLLTRKKHYFLILIFIQIFAYALESWERPEIPKDDIGRSKLASERDALHDQILEEEKARNEGKAIDETDLELKRKEKDYIESTLSIFDEQQHPTPDKKTKIDAAEKKRNEINDEITQLEQKISSGLNPSDGTSINKPNLIETAYLKVKKFFKERQLKKALEKNDDIVHISRLQSSLTDIYQKVNDVKAQEKLENLTRNFRPEAIKDHLQRFNEALKSDPDNDALKSEINNYIKKYVKKIIESGIEFDLENAGNKEELINYHNTLTTILKELGIDSATRAQALATITDALAQVTPQAIQETVSNFFTNKGTNTQENYQKLKKTTFSRFNDYNPKSNTNLKALEKTLEDLYHLSNIESSLSYDDKKQLNSFLSREYNDLAQAYEAYSKAYTQNNPLEAKINADTKATISHQRATRALNDEEAFIREETQKFEKSPELGPLIQNEIQKNKTARPLDENVKKLAQTNEQTIHNFQLSFEFNKESANTLFNETVLPTLDRYTTMVQQADPSRDALDYNQRVITSVEDLIHTLYDHAEDTFLTDSEKNLLATWVTELLQRAYSLNREKAQELQDLLRELPNGELIELPNSIKDSRNLSAHGAANQAVVDALKQQITSNKPKDYKQLYDSVIHELELKQEKEKKNAEGGGF